MSKKKTYLILIFVAILTVGAVVLSYPQAFNKLGFSLPNSWQVPFKLGLDLQGGTHLVYEADLSNIKKENYSSAMQGLRDIIERRVDIFGVAEPLVQTQEAGGNYRLIVELAGIKDPAEAIQMIGQTPFLDFREQRSEEETQKILDKIEEVKGKTFEEIQAIESWELAFEDPYFIPTSLTGKYLIPEKTELGFESNTQKPLIMLRFDDEGSKLFEELTSRNIGKILAIYIDGTPISTPVVQEPISGGKAQISGDFTIEEAQKLVKNLKAGALPVPIKLISQQSVGPVLGAVSLQKSLKAGIYGFLLISLFLIIYYRLPGLLASLALFVYVVVIIALFKLIPVTLTLAGIAGFILSLGMAVDANILIFSRMKEELKQGKTFIVSLEEGFKRSWPSVRDGNLTVIIVAVILFVFSASFVKGFAFTLIIGNIVSVFSANFITYHLMKFFVGTKFERLRWLW